MIYANSELAKIEQAVLFEVPPVNLKRAREAHTAHRLRSVCASRLQDFNIFQIDGYLTTPPVSMSANTDYIVKLIENILTLIGMIAKAEKPDDYSFAIAVFAQCRSNKSLTSMLIDQWSDVFKAFLQDGSTTATFSVLRNLLDKYDSVKKLPIFQKLYKFLMYCIGTSLFEKMGVKFNPKRFGLLEEALIKKEFHMGPDFIHCMLDTILFLCETGHQCMVTGSLDPIFHHETTYEKWIQGAELIRTQAKFITNPEPHGFTVFDFLSRLDDTLDKGKSMIKFAGKDSFAANIVRRLVLDLENIRADCRTKRLAQQDRKAPFAVLVSGGSSIAKSTFTKLLYYHFGKLFNLPIGSEFKYTRNAFDQYWTNFNSSQWCVQLDDIAFLHPNSSQGCDPSLMEMLQVVNNVPYVPTQADIVDKGKTPLRARFVVATTNTENLNAETYFACPLAVQRRLPYIISLVPKPEYCREGCTMIDTAKLPAIAEGEYPDFWVITVKQIRPKTKDEGCRRSTHMGETAEAVVLETYSNVFDFLKWFSGVARVAEEVQDRAMACDEHMTKVELCAHDIPKNKCTTCSQELQTSDMVEYSTEWTREVHRRQYIDDPELNTPHYPSGYQYTVEGIMKQIAEMDIVARLAVLWYYSVLWIMQTFTWGPVFVGFFFGRWYVFWLGARLLHIPQMRHILFHLLGYQAYRRVCQKDVLVFCAAIGTGISIWKAYSLMSRKNILFENAPEPTAEKSSDNSGHLQGLSEERGSKPEAVGDKQENVWYKDHFECTTFDVTPSILSKCSWSLDDTTKYVANNCVAYTLRARTETTICEKFGKGICLGGHTYVFNNHGFPYDTFELDIIFQSSKGGINQNFTTLVTPIQIMRFPLKDLIVIKLPSIPPKKDIRSLFAKETFEGRFDGQYVTRMRDGDLCVRSFKATKLHKNFEFVDKDRNTHIVHNVWSGHTAVPTNVGDCGSLLIVKTSMGPMLLGIHVLGGFDTVCTSLSITSEFVYSVDGEMMSDNEPSLQVGNFKATLVELGQKSTVRYVEEGTMIVHGSLAGFRGKMKSRVRPTLMNQLAVRDGYQVKNGPPVMNSYVPWRKAILDMARPVTHIDLTVLQECVTAFTDDILSQLKPEDLAQVIVYDLNIAINGRPGLAYVDKMNRNTSAGFPFRKSKKHFLEACTPFDDYQHPVVVTDVIKEEMDKIIECYESGKVYCPVFVASLKDEPTSFKKIKEGKTRVFCGAPMPWSLVVRMYLLSTIRLIQKNRFLFESGPGTIAQSTEWDDIYEYITQYGEGRVIAGDYGKFDKRMPASVILAAFDVIKSILLAAGWSDRDLKVVCGIAEDTAFSTIDFHGDLIRCYGTNPSGHPLTVIINGLANSLYVRYCYYLNHPMSTCTDFKKHTSLMTYGDDMIMGVSPECTWFDHTKMQQTLADIDIQFTMADKERPSVPFIHIDEATFLRRSWRFEPELQSRVCPIEHDSIEKMLTTCVESKTVSMELHALSVLDTACREYFWYGKETFENKRKLFNSWIDELELLEYLERPLPTWHSLCEEFKQNSKLRV
jgi:hypothetical protein